MANVIPLCFLFCFFLLFCQFFFLITAFEECKYFSYYKDTQQCIIKSSRAAVLQGSVTNIDSGSSSNSYSRPTACSQQDANTDYYMPSNLGSASSVCYKDEKKKRERKERTKTENKEENTHHSLQSSASECCGKCSQVPGCNYWTFSSGTCWFKSNMGQKKSATG